MELFLNSVERRLQYSYEVSMTPFGLPVVPEV